MRKNNNGSILIVTLGFSLIFTMLGSASIYMATLHSGVQEQEILSEGAFWLAEAGVQRAFYNLPSNAGTFAESLGEGSYSSTSTVLVPNVRWRIDSTGVVNGFSRAIRVIVGPNVTKAIQTTGTFKSPGGDGLDDHIEPDDSFEENATLVFEDIMGVSWDFMSLNATHVIPDADGTIPAAYNGFSGNLWVEGDLKINSNISLSGNLIVDGDLTFSAGTALFNGIIWVEGKCKRINGDYQVGGAIFINDPGCGETSISGSSDLAFDEAQVDLAFSYIVSSDPQAVHHIVSWREVV